MTTLAERIKADLLDTANYYGGQWPSGGGRERFRSLAETDFSELTPDQLLDWMGRNRLDGGCPVSVGLYEEILVKAGIDPQKIKEAEWPSHVAHITGSFRRANQLRHWRGSWEGVRDSLTAGERI